MPTNHAGNRVGVGDAITAVAMIIPAIPDPTATRIEPGGAVDMLSGNSPSGTENPSCSLAFPLAPAP